MRTVGQWTTKMKRMAGDFQRQFNEAVREAELDDVKNQVTKLGKIDPMADLRKSLTKADTDLKADLKKVDDSIAGSLAKPDAVNPVPKTPPTAAPSPRRARCAGRDCRSRGRGRGVRRAGRRRAAARRSHDGELPKPDEDEIEASRAPLMDHLIELRKRLMWAMLAILVAFIVCFFFAKHIYNVLVFPYEWASGPDRDDQAHLHGAAGIPDHPDQARLLRRGVHRLPGDRDPDLQVRRARPLQERAPGVPALSDRDAAPLHPRRRRGLFRDHAAGADASSCRWSRPAGPARRRSSSCPRSTSISA